ncbi:MAG TPA: radical SAM protein [Gemmatimonadaceae bacterium]|nr:radical SAM protein [Gemmatimonadaceae bacterium]
MRQEVLFPELSGRLRELPVLGVQKDIAYHGTVARSVLNGPEVTGMGFWSINPYIGCAFGCAYCYARYAHRYVMERAAAADKLEGEISRDFREMPPWLAFERHIFVKQNAPAVLQRALRYGSARHVALAQGDCIVIGTATDPYQPAERRFRITRGILETLAQHEGLDVVVITKSPLITRDIDVLSRLARHSSLSVHLSLITLRRELARRLEPRAPTPESRVRALERLRQAGIEAGINCMPVLPGITDDPSDIEALVKRVAQAGATYFGACALRLQSSARKRYLPFIEQEFPHLAARYRAAYANSHHVSERYRAGLSEFVRRLCRKYGIPAGWDRDEDESPDEAEEVQPEPQLTLAL